MLTLLPRYNDRELRLPVTLHVTMESGQLLGKLYEQGYGDEVSRPTGSVLGGRWEFELSVNEYEADDPDCRDWEVSGWAELRNDGRVMEILSLL